MSASALVPAAAALLWVVERHGQGLRWQSLYVKGTVWARLLLCRPSLEEHSVSQVSFQECAASGRRPAR